MAAGAGVIWTPILVTALVIVVLESARLPFIQRFSRHRAAADPSDES